MQPYDFSILSSLLATTTLHAQFIALPAANKNVKPPSAVMYGLATLVLKSEYFSLSS